MPKKKVIIIGCGLIGYIYAKVLNKLKCEIIAIVDLDQMIIWIYYIIIFKKG